MMIKIPGMMILIILIFIKSYNTQSNYVCNNSSGYLWNKPKGLFLNIQGCNNTLDNDTYLGIIIQIPNSLIPFWVGISFNSTPMINQDMWAIEFPQNGTYSLYDLYSMSYIFPYLDTELFGTYDFVDTNYETINNDITRLTFYRKFNTGDVYDLTFGLPVLNDTNNSNLTTTDVTSSTTNNLSSSTINPTNSTSNNLLNSTINNITVSNITKNASSISNLTNSNNTKINNTNITTSQNSPVNNTPPVFNDGLMYVVWGSGNMTYHGIINKTKFFFKLYSNFSTSIIYDTNQDNPQTHFVLIASFMYVSWFVMNFIGVYSSKYLKFNPSWIYIHVFFSGGAGLITIALGFLGVSYVSQNQNYYMCNAAGHYYLGIFFIVLIIIQMVSGVIIRLIIHKDDLIHGDIHKYKIFHKIEGYLIVVIAFIMSITGLVIGSQNDEYSGVVGFIAAYMPLSIIIFMLIFRQDKIDNENSVELVRTTSELRREKIFYFTREEIHSIKKIKKIVFFDNYIVDVEEFIDYHPGGKVHLLESLGSDISRYLSGSLTININFDSHTHTIGAVSHLINNMIIGVFKENSKIIYSTNSKDEFSQIVKDDIVEMQYFDLPVVWVRSRIINVYVSEFRFSLKNNLSNFRFNRFITGHDWMGRQYSISSKKINKTRMYSVCLCLDETVYNYHRLLIDNLSKLEFNEKIISPKIQKNEMISDYMQIYVKKYQDPKALSKYIHEFTSRSEEDDFFAKGPIGFGLDLEEKLDGVYVAFAAGTGVLCFLDFIAYILRYMADKISTKKYGCTENRIMPDEDFSGIGEKFKLIYFTTFKDKFSTIFQELCERMDYLSEKHKFLDCFKFYSRITKNQPQKWDQSFITNELLAYKEKIKRVFICGTSSFLEDIQSFIIQGEIAEKEKITLI